MCDNVHLATTDNVQSAASHNRSMVRASVLVGLVTSLIPALAWSDDGDSKPGTVSAPPSGPATESVVVQVPAAQPQAGPVLLTQPGTTIEEGSIFGQRNAFLALRMGPGIAIQGPLEQSGTALGNLLNILLGTETQWGISVALSSSLRYHAAHDFDFKDVSLGATARYTLLHENWLHPWVECTLEFGSTAIDPKSTSEWIHFGGGSLRLGAGVGLGVEFDVAEHWSFEAGIRADGLFATKSWEEGQTNRGHVVRMIPNVVPGADWLLTPFAGVTFYR